MGENPASLSLLFAGPFTALERKLVSRFPAWSRTGPGRESILLVPSNELREHLLRRIAASAEGQTAGTRIQTLYDFALRLLAHRGIFPRELPPAQKSALLLAAVREAYAAGAGDFAGIAGTPGFLPALARTLADLEEGWLGDDALAAAGRRARERGNAAAAARWAEWRRLFAAVGKKIRAAGGMSRQAIFQEAVKGFEQPGYPFRVRLYGFYDFTRLQWTLVDALLASGLLDEIYFPALCGADGALDPSFGYAGAAWERLRRAFEGNLEILDDPVEPGLSRVRARIFSPVPPAAADPVPFQILSAPHEEGEMRLAARRVRAWRDERPGEDILVVSRRFDEESVSSWERVAAEYGIPAVERLHVPLSSVPPVRVLLQMIEAAAEGFPRRKVIDVLSSPYRRLAGAAGGPAARPDLWDVISRELLVVSGNDWERCLSGKNRARGDDETEEPADETGRDAQRARLQAEVRALAASLRPLQAAQGYGELAAAVRRLLRDDFLLVDDDSPEAERDRRGLGALFVLLDDIEQVPARAVSWPGTREALAWFRTLLSAQRLFVGRKGGLRIPGAVVAGDLLALRGVTADRVLFLSVNEDVVPAQLDEDPLLPDEERRALNEVARQPGLPDALSLRRRDAAEEKLLFSLPAAAARREVAFSVLRGDMEGGTRRPSRYLLQLLSQFAGPGVFSEDWVAASKAPSLFLSRDPFVLLENPGPVSPREAALLAWRRGDAPADGPGGIPWHRVAAILSEFGDRESGASPVRALDVPPRVSRPASASQLDELSRCPYRYFPHRRIGLSPVEEPEEGLSLTAAEMGLIVHDILKNLGTGAAGGSGWGELPAAAAAAFARFARERPAILRGLFRIQCRAIERDVAALVDRERNAADGAFRVAAVEQPFAFPAAGGLPAFEGRVDRIDRGPSGEARIVDYKYRDGTRERPPLDGIRHGLSNQIPVYLLYADTLAPRPPSVAAALVFLRNGVRDVTVDGTRWAEAREEWREAVSGWLGLAASGLFPPLPHHRFRFAGRPSPRYCDACPFKDHCRVSPAFDGAERDTEALGRRIAGDPRIRVVAAHRAGGEG